MNYFVNENIFSLNSGTEFSAISRVKLFKQNGVAAKMLTRNYNPELVDDTERVGLAANDVLNMYSFFQEITSIEKKDVDVRYTDAIDKNMYQIEGIDPNKSLIHYHGRTVGQVDIAPGTVGLVGAIEYFNDFNDLVAKDIWDRRGFKSSTQYYHPDGKEGAQVFFNAKGEPKIEITRMNIDGQLHNTMYKLVHYKGHAWRFNTENEMFAFFMNEITSQEPSVLINDRPSLINEVASVKNAKGKWQFLHNAHTVNTAQLGGSNKVYDYMKPLFKDHIRDFDGVIVPTEQQRKEITKFFGFDHVLVLGDTYTVKHDLATEPKRDLNKIVFLGRISPEKQPNQALEVFAKAKEKLPDLHLEFYGYASDNALKQSLSDLAKKLNVENAVTYNGYQDAAKLTEQLKDAGALLTVSMSEGFGANIVEAMSYGIPVFGYDVKYGLSSLIQNGANGYLEPLNASQVLADDLVKVLSGDAKEWTQLSQKASATAEGFNAPAAWKLWQKEQSKTTNLFVK
ncbi:MAG TPA: glycosyl transferase family 1 [Lactobacillus sp.]|nr:glycosyl transferase family 1 [Lactobacillus sp.]